MGRSVYRSPCWDVGGSDTWPGWPDEDFVPTPPFAEIVRPDRVGLSSVIGAHRLRPDPRLRSNRGWSRYPLISVVRLPRSPVNSYNPTAGLRHEFIRE